MRVFVLISLVALALTAPIANDSDNIEPSPAHTLDYSHFWSYDEVVDFLNEVEAEFPNIAKVEQMGRSEEGRDIWGIRIALEEHLEAETLPVVFITAGASARDWIATMSAIHVIHMLTEHYHLYSNIVDDLEWFIIPIANPDGYVFSMEAEENRAWIKNRRVNAGSDCLGVNIERNFDFNFGTGVDSSDDPCADNFRGPAADSEEETKTIQFAVDIFRRIQHGYISIKAGSADNFNGLIAYPFAFSNEGIPNNWEEQQEVSWLMSDSVRSTTGARFIAGSYNNLNGPADGTSMDYAVGVDNIPLAYTVFTPPGGQFGWDVPAWRIQPIADQVFFAIERFARYAVEMPLENPQK